MTSTPFHKYAQLHIEQNIFDISEDLGPGLLILLCILAEPDAKKWDGKRNSTRKD